MTADCQERKDDMMCPWKRLLAISMALLAMGAGTVLGQGSADPLKSGFDDPPNGARPRVWWHWMNGNISQEGITADLQWMHRVGLGGYQNFDAALETPQVVPKRLAYMTPEWKEAFKHAILLGDQLGLEMAIAGSPGWSESGGPWVPGSEGMKKYVWSATLVQGGKPFSGALPHPPSNSGAFQNEGIHDEPTPGAAPIPDFYKDSVVVAYKRPAADKAFDDLQAKITASGGSPDFAMLSDGDLEKTTKLPIPAPGETSWIQYEFPQPQAIRAVTFVTKNDPANAGRRLTRPWKPATTGRISVRWPNSEVAMRLKHTISFPAVTAKYFRVTFKRHPSEASTARIVPPKPTDYRDCRDWFFILAHA